MHTEHSECIVSVYCRESQLFRRFAGTNILPPPPLPPAAPPGIPELRLQSAGRLGGGPWFERRAAHICRLCMRLFFIHLFIDLLSHFPAKRKPAPVRPRPSPSRPRDSPPLPASNQLRLLPLPRLCCLLPAIFPSPPLYSRSSLSFFLFLPPPERHVASR